MNREAGKGDKRRPQSVSDKKVKDNWDNIFKSNTDAKEVGEVCQESKETETGCKSLGCM